MEADACLSAALQLREQLLAQCYGADATVVVATFDGDFLWRATVDADAGARRQRNSQWHGDYRGRLAVGRQVADRHVHQALAAFLEHQILKDEAAFFGSIRRLLATGGPILEGLTVLRPGLNGSAYRQRNQQQGQPAPERGVEQSPST